MALTKATERRFERITDGTFKRAEDALGSRLEDSFCSSVRGGNYREFEVSDGAITVRFIAVGMDARNGGVPDDD